MTAKIRIGIIGTSWWTDLMYVPSLRSHVQADVVAISGRNFERAAEVAEKFRDARVYTDYRDLIAAGGIDAVVVATPDDLHYAMTMMALDAGLHVLCEKPLANTAAAARAMLNKAKEMGVKHMILFTWRWQPHWRFVKRLIDGGYIGRCHQARFQFLVPLSGGAYQWRYDAARANGVAGDLGSHMIDFAHWFIGDVKDVSADLQVLNPQKGLEGKAFVPANDAAFLSLAFRGGAHAQVHVSAAERLGDQGAKIRVALYGDKGTIEAEHVYFGTEAGVKLRGISGDQKEFQTLCIPEDLSEGLDQTDLFSPYINQSAGPRLFIDSIINDVEPVPDFNVGVMVQAVVDAALKSNATDQRVAVAY